MNKSAFQSGNFSEQNFQPALAFLCTELLKSLWLEHGEQEQGACSFFGMVRKYTIKPLATIDLIKGNLVPEDNTFSLLVIEG